MRKASSSPLNSKTQREDEKGKRNGTITSTSVTPRGSTSPVARKHLDSPSSSSRLNSTSLSNTHDTNITEIATPTIDEVAVLKQENRKLLAQRVTLTQKIALLEEKARVDLKKIQALELVLQRESSSSSVMGGNRIENNKYSAQIDALSTKIYKLEEKNQAMAEELASLKSDTRNKKKEQEAKIREIQQKHEFDLRAMEQQQREFTSGLKKETRKDVDGLKQHLVVQETDLQKKHLREVQDLKAEHLDKELKLKQIIHLLQDELDHVKQSGKRAAIRRVESNYSIADETTPVENEEDPDECY